MLPYQHSNRTTSAVLEALCTVWTGYGTASFWGEEPVGGWSVARGAQQPAAADNGGHAGRTTWSTMVRLAGVSRRRPITVISSGVWVCG